ncbi:recombinase family protein [Melissococcus plutonius]|uniref:recombinase family protein n=1 Tax=Melissococcus plutonius TaxID=33970 RepID=UPI003C2FBC9C
MQTAIYVRVSTNEQAEEGYSIDEQIDKLTKFCEIKEWNVTHIYKDPGFTGSNMERPGLQKLIRDVKLNRIDTILVYKLDRLSRSQKDTLYLIEDIFEAKQTAFVSLNENFDTSTPFGKAMIGILAVFAQLEREQIKERMTMGKLGRAKSGKAMSWHWAPFGYKYIDGNYVINDLESQVVKQIFYDYLSGISITKLKDKLNEEGHIAKDIPWSYRTIRQTLDNPTYAGYTKYKDQIFEGNHMAIISKDIFNKTQEQLAIRQQAAYAKNNNPRPFQAKYLISGLVRCGICGSSLSLMQYNLKKDGTRTKIYRCYSRIKKRNLTQKQATSCTSSDYKKETLEYYVLTELEKLRINPNSILELEKESDTPSFDIVSLERKLSELDTKLEKLINLYIDDSLPKEVLEKKKIKILDEQKRIEERINNLEINKPELEAKQAINILSKLETSVLKLSYDKQKILVRQLVREITVIDNAISIEWRFAQ